MRWVADPAVTSAVVTGEVAEAVENVVELCPFDGETLTEKLVPCA